MKILFGNTEIELKTKTEILLANALKMVILLKGDPPTLNDAIREFKLERYSFVDVDQSNRGTLQIAMDGNNGRDLVRVKK